MKAITPVLFLAGVGCWILGDGASYNGILVFLGWAFIVAAVVSYYAGKSQSTRTTARPVPAVKEDFKYTPEYFHEKEKAKKFEQLETTYGRDSETARLSMSRWLCIRGESFAERNELDNAERDLKDAVALDPAYISAYVSLSSVYGMKGAPKEALTLLQSMPKLSLKNSEHFGMSYSLGLAYMEMGDTEKAIQSFEACLSAREAMRGGTESANAKEVSKQAKMEATVAQLLRDLRQS